MSAKKVLKDWLFKAYLGKGVVPVGLVELHRYFAHNREGINFFFHKEDDYIVAKSSNFRYGSIITFAQTKEELDEKIQDAILTAFGVPSSYSQEAGIHKVSQDGELVYASA